APIRHRLADLFRGLWYAGGERSGSSKPSLDTCAGASPNITCLGRHVPCILRAPGGPVDLERYPLRVGPRVDQVKRHVQAGVGEEPRALPDDHGADEQVDLVDKMVVEQPPGQGAAAV